MNNPAFDTWLSVGGYLRTSGTTGNPKNILQSTQKITASNTAAIIAQGLTSESKVLTTGKLKHAGGIFAQTLPAYTLDAEIDIIDFSPEIFKQRLGSFTHTHLTPNPARNIMSEYDSLYLKDVWGTCGSTPVTWDIVEWFVGNGAIFMANWGMTEVGPISVNTKFDSMYKVDQMRLLCPDEHTILGDQYYCDYRIVNGELIVKGNISVYGNNWFHTGDLVTEVNGVLFFKGRK